MTIFNIEVVSDNVCPWCYVGKKKLEKGIAQYRSQNPASDDTFSVTWLPFYLNPDAPKPGVDKQAYYLSRFGPERTKMMQERLSQIGEAEGIHFKFGGKTGNTRDSHRLVQLGKTKGPEMQTRVVEELFAAYFEKEQDITSHQVLTEVGVRAGLDESEVTEWLKSEGGGELVDREVRESQMGDISGVPNFTINGRFEVGGAQDPSAFVKLFKRLKAEEEKNGGTGSL